MSIIKKISIKNAIQQAQDNMGIDHNRDIPLFTTWAVEADRKIGSYYSYKRKIVVLDVVNCRAELPCEAVAVLSLIFGDCGCDCGLLFNDLYSFININPANAGSGWIFIDDSGGSRWRCGVSYEIQNNHLVFNGNFDGEKVTVQILAMETDADGFPLINENHVDAISQYIEYKHALRTRWNSIENKITETGIADMKIEWGRTCRSARAESGEPSLSDLEEIRNMINDPLSGVGIHLYKLNDRWLDGWY